MCLIAYTDGSAVVSGQNKGKGGYGVYFPDFDGQPKGLYQGFENTKTGRVEQMGLLAAIKSIPYESDKAITLKVFSDSQYVVKAFTDHRLDKWISNGWTNTSGKVKNRDLWEKILFELSARKSFLTLDINWIKGHQLDKEKDPKKLIELKKDPHVIGNAMADKLAENWRTMKNLKQDL